MDFGAMNFPPYHWPMLDMLCHFNTSPMLVVTGTMEFWMTFHILGIIIPSDFHIFQRGWKRQPVKLDTLYTSYIYVYIYSICLTGRFIYFYKKVRETHMGNKGISNKHGIKHIIFWEYLGICNVRWRTNNVRWAFRAFPTFYPIMARLS